jgi:4-alpha-glucanotransferase
VPGYRALGAEELERAGRLARGDGQRIDRARSSTPSAALEQLWERQGQPETAGFAAFVAEQGDALDPLRDLRDAQRAPRRRVRALAARAPRPGRPAVAEVVAEEHADRLRFHAWVQWLLDEQLRAAGEAAPADARPADRGRPAGRGRVGVAGRARHRTTVGAPRRARTRGAGLAVPAFVPWKLRQAAYRPFIETLRAAFRHAAALRIDHVLGLFRLFWIPPAGPRSGPTSTRTALRCSTSSPWRRTAPGPTWSVRTSAP